MNNDPADERARARRDLGLTRETQQQRAILPHPARGGTRGYPVWSRLDAIDDRQNGRGDIVRSSIRSYYRWLQRPLPYRMTGNNDRQAIVGLDAMLLTIFITVHPTSTHEEQAAFIFNEGGVSGKLVALKDRRVQRVNVTGSQSSLCMKFAGPCPRSRDRYLDVEDAPPERKE